MSQYTAADSKFVELAKFIANQNSTCVRRAVGCVLVYDRAVIATGYNGVPSKEVHPCAQTCVRIGLKSGEQPEKTCCTHAEANAVALAARDGHATKGATAYCTDAPCTVCARLLYRAGIVRVVCAQAYGDQGGLELLRKHIDVVCL